MCGGGASGSPRRRQLLDARHWAWSRGPWAPLQLGFTRAAPLQSEVTLTACFTQLTQELEELKEIEASLERQEREVDEDTTVTIPSAV